MKFLEKENREGGAYDDSRCAEQFLFLRVVCALTGEVYVHYSEQHLAQ